MNHGELSRRDFFSSTLAAGSLLAFSGLNRVLAAEAASSSAKTPTRIQVVYMAKPIPTWPCPDLDVRAEMDKIDQQLRAVQKQCGHPVQFCGGQLVRTADDMPGFLAGVREVDGILAFNLTSTCGPMFTPIVSLGIPTVLFSQPYSGHDWSTVSGMQKQGKKVQVISSSDVNDLLPVLRILAALRRTRQTHILCLRAGQEKKSLENDLEARFGLRIPLMDYSELNALYAQADAKAAAEMADAFIAGAMRMIEPGRKDVIDYMKLY